jgi:CheY-like chemotaxis protein
MQSTTREFGETGLGLQISKNRIDKLGGEILRPYGLDAELGNDGVQAIEAAKHSHFDMIFMDLQMPNIDAFEATRVIRLNDIGTPIVALFASVLKEDVKKAQQVGMKHHIAKPIVRWELISVLHQFIKS